MQIVFHGEVCIKTFPNAWMPSVTIAFYTTAYR